MDSFCFFALTVAANSEIYFNLDETFPNNTNGNLPTPVLEGKERKRNRDLRATNIQKVKNIELQIATVEILLVLENLFNLNINTTRKTTSTVTSTMQVNKSQHVSRAEKKNNSNEDELKKRAVSDFVSNSLKSRSQNRLQHVTANSTLKKFSFPNTVTKYTNTVKMMSKNAAVTRTASGSSIWTTDEIARKLSWGQILQHRTTNRTVFDNCDPYRSLHFLVEELCTKVHCTPGANTAFVDKIVKNIREIMLRIPECGLKPNQKGDKKSNVKILGKKLLEPEKEKENRGIQTLYIPKKLKPKMDSKLTQTTDPKAFDKKLRTQNKISQASVPSKVFSFQAYLLDKEFDEKIKTLNERCHTLEVQINALTTERNNYKNLYERQLERVLSLEYELSTTEEVFREEKSKFLEEICVLTKENDDLKRASQKLADLEIRNKILENDLETAQREAISAQLNFEKMSLLVQNRDKQLDELHQEFCNIQNVVTTQMAEVYTQVDLPFYTPVDVPQEKLETPSFLPTKNIQSPEDDSYKKNLSDNLTSSSVPQSSYSDTPSNTSLSMPSNEDANLKNKENVPEKVRQIKKPYKLHISLNDQCISENSRPYSKLSNFEGGNTRNDLIKKSEGKFKLVDYVESKEDLQSEIKVPSALVNKCKQFNGSKVKKRESKTSSCKDMDPEVVKYDLLINKIVKFVKHKSKHSKKEKTKSIDEV